MSYSWVKICNMALLRIGAKSISALTETPSGIAWTDVYQDAADEVIAENKLLGWRDARRRGELTVDSTAPAFGWDYRYLLPASPWCLTLVKIENEPDYEIEGRYILTDAESPLNIIYDARITDPTSITPELAKAIAAKIAQKITYRMVQDKALRDRIMDEAERDIMKARQDDALHAKNASVDEKGGYSWIDR